MPERDAPGRRVEVLAPAKVNLTLAVLGRRSDGYHELETLMATLDLKDVIALEVTRSAGLTLKIDGEFAGPDIPLDDRNLALHATRAALARAAELGVPEMGIALSLTKRIPSKAGLGGASSDAASSLHAVEKLLAIDLGRAWRHACLARLGSDCVFFDVARSTGLALCKGRGERVEAWPSLTSDWWFVLIAPELDCPTVEVYSALETPLSPHRTMPNVPRDLPALIATQARQCLFNHLEAAAVAVVPELSDWRAVLNAAGASHFQLTGSGSSLFGLYDDPESAHRALQRILDQARAKQLALRGHWVVRADIHNSRDV